MPARGLPRRPLFGISVTPTAADHAIVAQVAAAERAGLADLGVDAFMFWPPDTGTGQVERFAHEVVPAVRAALP